MIRLMNNFSCHRRGVDVQPLLSELLSNQSAWFEQTGRQRRAAVQAETNAIPIRGLRRSMVNGRRRRDVHETRYTSLAERFPETVALLEALATGLDGRLGRAKFARLPPGGQVLPHVDRGEYYAVRDRFHLVIDSNGGSVLRAGEEEVRMKTGELWWFDNKALHSARNGSDSPRIHLVFDLQRIDIPATNTRSAGVLPDPYQLLRASVASEPTKPIQAIAEAVEIYLAVRKNPRRWQVLLKENGLIERAQSAPIAVLAELLWPGLEPTRRRRRESAIGWALAQMDLGRLSVSEIPGALDEFGGIRAVHRAWCTSKDKLLYGQT
jgi:hypothetical protein